MQDATKECASSTDRHAGALFRFATPRYRLEAHGARDHISASGWNGKTVAREIEKAFINAKLDGEPNPVLVGAVPFDSRQPAHLYVPRKCNWQSTKPHTPPEADQAIHLHGYDSPAYRASVAKALRRISIGALDKVVLARRVVAESRQPFDVDAIYSRLYHRNPSAFVYQIGLPRRAQTAAQDQGPVLLGASPELVLGIDGDNVKSAPLAGSIPRGSDKEQDEQRAADLLSSQKDLYEHAVVVRAVGAHFRRHCQQVHIPDKPNLVQTPVIWHLGSHVSGLLRSGVHPIELAYALHPTPAVSGWPQKAARQAISELENFDRGFFAGLVGWMDAKGNGEWALTLRCGVIDGARADVFAGAGIVDGSDPEKEHTETATKLRTFLSALGRAEHPAIA